MDQQTKEKIEKFFGLDFCCPGKQRMFCPKHMWDVPTIYRRQYEKFWREKTKQAKPLTTSCACGIEE